MGEGYLENSYLVLRYNLSVLGLIVVDTSPICDEGGYCVPFTLSFPVYKKKSVSTASSSLSNYVNKLKEQGTS